MGGNSVINLLCLGIQGMEALLQETYTLKNMYEFEENEVSLE